jgi:hypothetical protein
LEPEGQNLPAGPKGAIPMPLDPELKDVKTAKRDLMRKINYAISQTRGVL